MAKKVEIDNAKLRDIQKTAYAGETSFAAECEALRAVLIDGKVPKVYADAYKTAVVAAMLGLPRTKAGLEEAAKPDHADIRARAANRLSRRVKAIGAEAAHNSGRARGAQMPKAAPEAAQAAPAPAAAPEVVEAPDAPANPVSGLPVAKVGSVAEFDAVIHGMTAWLAASAKASKNHVDGAHRRALMGIAAAAEGLRASRRDNDEPAH